MIFLLLILTINSLPITSILSNDTIDSTKHIFVEEYVNNTLSLKLQDTIVRDTVYINIVNSSNIFDDEQCFVDISKFIKDVYKYREEIVLCLIFIVITISFIILLLIKIISCINKSTYKYTIDVLMQIILVSTIIAICIFSQSSWSYLALVVLCILSLDKYKHGLLGGFSKVAAALQGKDLDLTPSTQKELDQKRQAEALEEEYIEDTQNTATDESVKEEQNSDNAEVREETVERRTVNFKEILHSRVQEYSKVEQLALQYLEEEYPNLQKSVRLRINSHDRIDLDGLVQNKDSNIIVEIKFCRSVHPIKYDLNKLHEVAKYIFHRTGKITEVLLFVVTESDDLKQKLENLYRQPFQQTNLLQVRVHTLKELEQSISKQQ